MIIQPASKDDFVFIVDAAKRMELDLVNAHFHQFFVARFEGKILGFARIISHEDFFELATLGVLKESRKKKVGSNLVTKISESVQGELFIVTVIPDFFSRLKYEKHETIFPVFLEKINFCKSFHFDEDQIFVMKYMNA